MLAKSITSESGEIKTANKPNGNGLSMVIFSGDMDKVLAAFIIAIGASAIDMPVSMFFTFWGLNVLRSDLPAQLKSSKSLVEKMFGRMMPRGASKLHLSKMDMGGMGTLLMKREMKKKKVSDLPTLLKEARELGVKLVACEMSMDIMGIKIEELIPGIERVGVAIFIDSAKDSKMTLFI